MDVTLKDIDRSGVDFAINGVCVRPESFTTAWRWHYAIEVSGTRVYVERSKYIFNLLEAIKCGDRWYQAVLRLLGLLSYDARVKHFARAFEDSAIRSAVEEGILKGIWISVNMRGDRFLAEDALHVMKVYGGPIVNRKAFEKYKRKFEEVEIHLLAKKLCRR